MEMKKRSEILDISKGIAILLVVWAHARAPFSGFIYQFHMPFFFLISGYLYNKDCSLKTYICKKTKTLYMPFIVCNILGGGIKWICGFYSYTFKTYIRYVINVLLTLTKDGQFFGATWFLGALYIVAIVYKCLDYFIADGKYKRIFLCGLFTASACIGFSINFPYMQSRTMILGMFYALGAFVKDNKDEFVKFDKPVMALFSFLLFIAGAHYNNANMGANEYTYRLVFVIGALCAGYCMIHVSGYLVKTIYIKKLLILFSKYSIDIVIWQFVVFRIAIVIQLYMHDLPINTVLDYYPVYDTMQGWWILYVVIGMLASMFVGWFLRGAIYKIKRRN